MKTNYLNNRDLLAEIHASKISYCSFKNADIDSQFDIIVDDVNEITKKKTILAAKENRLNRLEKENPKQNLTIKDIPVSDLVFRVMTWEHIPIAPPKTSKKKNSEINLLEELDLDNNAEVDELVEQQEGPESQTHVKVNFPPFVHYKLDPNNEPELVGKSHWLGDLTTGHFSKTHGSITEKLAHMYMKLCERYSSRSNWRGYTYNDEMRAQSLLQVVQVGLQFNEAKSSNPFSYLTMILQNSFTRILNIEKRNQAIRDDLLEKQGYNPSMARQMKANAMSSLD